MPSRPEGIKCPECYSSKVWKDGIRYTSNGEIQRYVCRSCGFRFSESSLNRQVKVDITSKLIKKSNSGKNLSESNVVPINFAFQPSFEDFPFQRSKDVGSHGSSEVTNTEKSLNSFRKLKQNCQESDESKRRAFVALARGAKNLAEVESRDEKRAAGATIEVDAAITGWLIEYAWHEKKRGLSELTIRQRIYRLKRLLKRSANLLNPESVSAVLASSELSAEYKKAFIVSYKSFAKTFGLQWEPPRVRTERKVPFIPTEAEIDTLIAGCGKRTAAFLQVLKDTGARGSEACRLKWQDVDEKTNTLRINNPTKGSMARVVKVSPKTIAMINSLPKNSEYIFNTNISTIRKNFTKQRNKLAVKLQNPRLRQIHLHTIRHWKATMEYYKTKNIKYVQYLLGHKKIENTDIYTHLINFEGDEWHVALARNLEEEKKLIEVGFEFVRYSEKDEVAIYRKRK